MMDLPSNEKEIKACQGVVANMVKLLLNGSVGFIDWVDA